MNIPAVDQDYLLRVLKDLCNTPSPTGYTDRAVELVKKELEQFKMLDVSITSKGALLAAFPGESDDTPRAISTHVDTLGAMVKEIKPNGKLKMTQIGGFHWSSVEGEGCTVITRSGKEIRGTIMLYKTSSHVHGKELAEIKREDNTMEVRLDARTCNAEDTRELGIEVGDFVAFDPRVEINNGFVRSRHLDDKACAATSLAAIKALADAGMKPKQTTWFYFSTYEEVGHGGCQGIPGEVKEVLIGDMAAVGEGQTSDEFSVTICVKDSSGPYDYHFSNKLKDLAAKNEIPCKVDIYPYYGSDGSMYWRSGGHGVVALIGPGVESSHNYERTHTEALMANTNLNLAWLLS